MTAFRALRRSAFAGLVLAAVALPARAGDLTVDLRPVTDIASEPRMGDRLVFRSVVRNHGATLSSGRFAWVSLVRIDPDQEQPVDLEDWSARSAAVIPPLDAGQAVETDWPLRLIQSGRYAVMVSVAGRRAPGPAAGFQPALGLRGEDQAD